MGSSCYEKARIIANQHSANFKEVYDLLKQGKSVAAVTRKVKRRWRRLCYDRKKVEALLKIYGNGYLYSFDLVREAVAEKILKDANAGKANEATEFVLQKLKTAKRRVILWSIIQKIVVAIIIVGAFLSFKSNRASGHGFGAGMAMACVVAYTLSLIGSFSGYSFLKMFKKAAEKEQYRERKRTMVKCSVVWSGKLLSLEKTPLLYCNRRCVWY